ncbi:MAG: hypothetical protein ACR2GZ_02175 [Solirubrobacteraceae bacterium]
MTYTERDDKQDKSYDERSDAGGTEAAEGSSKDKLPFMPAQDDESPLGSTDQHSDA